MGWWNIKDVKTGQIDPAFVSPRPTVRLVNGDGPADAMGVALDRIAEMYREAWDRDPLIDELQAVFNFVVGPERKKGKFYTRGRRTSRRRQKRTR